MTKERLVKGLTYCYMIPFCAIVVVNVFFSILRSTYFELYLENELPSYRHDNAPMMILVLCFTAIILGLVYAKVLVKCEKMRIFVAAACCWAAIASLFFVFIFRCGVVCDAMHVSNMTVQFMQNNYSAFEKELTFTVILSKWR